MGQTESSEPTPVDVDLISQLSSLEVVAVSDSFKELHSKAGRDGHVLNLEAFSEHFKLPVLLGERLFQALDWKKTNTIDFEEFVSGAAMLLHGSFHDKCQLLFSMFNISGGAGIDRNELSTILNIILSSTQLVLKGCGQMQTSAQLNEGAISDIVARIVKQAFNECDVSKTNKLSPEEFEMWLEKNPELVEHLVKWTLPSDKQVTYKLGGVSSEIEIQDNTVKEKEETLLPSEVSTPDELPSQQKTDIPHLNEEDPVSKPIPLAKTTSELEELDTMETIPDAITGSAQELHKLTPVSPSSNGSCSDDESAQTNKRPEHTTCPHFMLTAEEHSIYSTLWIPGVVTREAVQQRKYLNKHPIPQDLTCHELIAPHKIESKMTEYDIKVAYQPRLSLADVEVTSEGLEKLVEVGNYIDALHLTRDVILQTRSVSAKQSNVEYSPLILQTWLARFTLMLKLGLKRELEDEIESLAGSNFDRPDMYFEFYPDRYEGKCGWMVPFGLVLLYASLPNMLGQHRRSLDRLYYVIHTAQRVRQHILSLEASEHAKSQGVNLWQKRINRITLAIASTFISMKDYYNARLIFSNMAKEQPTLLADCSIIKSRIHLLIGNTSAASKELKIAEENLDNPGTYPRYLMACGLLDVAEKRYHQAEQTFRKVQDISPCSAAINNIGFCLYYQAHMDQALECWESLLFSEPPDAIHADHLSNIKSIVGVLPNAGYSIKVKILDVLAKRSPELIRHIL